MRVFELVNGKRWGISPTELTVSLHRVNEPHKMAKDNHHKPDSYKCEFGLYRKRFLEHNRLCVSNFIVSLEYVIREGNFLKQVKHYKLDIIKGLSPC